MTGNWSLFLHLGAYWRTLHFGPYLSFFRFNPLKIRVLDGGGGGIRTHGTLRPSGFQDRRNRPLYHPSENDVSREALLGMRCFSRRNELGMHLSVMHAVDCAIAKSEAGRQAGVWPLLRGAHESRRGGMVDATDLKSVEGQPSWGFESPRRHMGCHLQSPQNPQSVLRCRPMGIVGDWNQFFHAALADQ